MIDSLQPTSSGSVPRVVDQSDAPHVQQGSNVGLAIISAVFVGIVLLGAGITMLLPLRQTVALEEIFTPEHVEQLGMIDNTAQRLGYRLGLGLLGLLILGGAVLVPRISPRVRPWALATRIARRSRDYGGLLVVIAASLIILLNLQETAFGGSPVLSLRLTFVVAAVAITLLLMARAQSLASRWFAVAAWIFILAYVLFLAVPGFLHTIFLPETLLSHTELHYSVTLAQGDRLAAGLSLGEDVSLNYGLLHQMILASVERGAGFLDFAQHIRLVQASQVLFLLVALLSFYLWKPRNLLFILFACLLIGPWLSTVSLAIYTPNEAGWRSLGLAAGVVLLLLVRGQPLRRMALVLGAGAGLLIFYNPETGICLALGYALFLLSRSKVSEILAVSMWAAVGLGLCLVLLLMLYRVGLGHWPPLTPLPYLSFFTQFSEGYGSLPLYFDPLALIIFVHCAYLVVFTILSWRRRELGVDESVKLALAGTILLWFTYYVNRPYAWNLWTFQYLYVFLFAGFLEPSFLRKAYQRGIRTLLTPAAATFILVLLPSIMWMHTYTYAWTTEWVNNSGGSREIVSGVAMPRPSADYVRNQAAFLAKQPASDTLFLTRHSYSISLLTGRFVQLPVQDAFAETTTNRRFENLVASIQAASPRMILIDAPGSDPATDPSFVAYYDSFFDRVKTRIAAQYEAKGVTDGWEVWELRATSE